MSRDKGFLEVIPAAALSTLMPEYLALLIPMRKEDGVLEALLALYPQSKYKIAVIDPSISSNIPQLLEQAAALGIPAIFLQPEAPAAADLQHLQHISATLISKGAGTEPSLLQDLIAHPSTKDISWIGYQTYHSNPELLIKIQNKYFSALRLGAFREDFKAAEPLIRANSLHFLDLCAIRHSDAPEGLQNGPNGLYAEEICQLARYVGMCSSMDACFVYGYPEKLHSLQIISQVIAQILWHLFESLATHCNETPYNSESNQTFSEKEVHIGGKNQTIKFLLSRQTGRWWMDVSPDVNILNFVPCTYEEYTTAAKGEIPLSWLKHYQKQIFL